MQRQAGFTFVEILVVMSIIVVLAGMTMVIVPWVQERGRQTESINNVKNLVLLLSDQAQTRRSWPGFNGKNFTLSLVATNAVDRRRKDNLRVFFSPGDRTFVYLDTDFAKYDDITLQSLRQGGQDNRPLTSYAGRRNRETEFRITPDVESMGAVIICDDDQGNLHHPRGLIMGFTDGGSRFIEWADLDMAPPEEIEGEVEPFLGDDAANDELRAMSSE